LNALEKLGLIRNQDAKGGQFMNWKLIKTGLGLIVDVNEKEPNDIAYVYSGYAPMSIRLVQKATAPEGWRGIQEVLGALPGATLEIEQELPPGVVSAHHVGGTGKVTLVVFLGGVTYTEISALRWLSQQQEDREYIVASTALINGNTILESVLKSSSG